MNVNKPVSGAVFAVVASLTLMAPVAWGQEVIPDDSSGELTAPSATPEPAPGEFANPTPSVAPTLTPSPAVMDSVPAVPAAPADLGADRRLKLKNLDAAIAKQAQRRTNAKAGFVIGGVMILGGIVVSAVQTADDEEERAQQTGQYSEEVSLNWTGFGVGVLIAVPIILASVSTLRDANRQARELRYQKQMLTVGSVPGGASLNISFSF